MADKNAAEMLQYWHHKTISLINAWKFRMLLLISDGHNKMVNVNNKRLPLVILNILEYITKTLKDTNKFFVP